MTDAVQVFMFTFPTTKIHEAVVENFDGSYTILIADCLSPDAKRKAYLHALSHIERGDFSSSKSVNEIEYETHEMRY